VGINPDCLWAITPYYRAVTFANQNQWQQAYHTYQQAVQRDTGNALAHQQLALSAAVLAEKGNQNLLAVAIEQMETTIQLEPSWALNHANLAALYLENNDLDNAVLSAEKAFILAPRAPLYALNLGFILEQTGNEPLAKEAFLKALDLSPAWSTASYWEESILRTDALNQWVQTQPASEPLTLEESKIILENNNLYSWAYNQYAAELLEQGIMDEARKTLINAALVYTNSIGDSVETDWLWAEYNAQIGDFEKAIELGSSAIKNHHHNGVYGPGSFGALQYAPNLFRLSAMALEIVPQMVDVPAPEIWLERAELLKTWEEQVQ